MLNPGVDVGGTGDCVFCGERGAAKVSRVVMPLVRDIFEATIVPPRTHECRATSRGLFQACCVRK